MKKNTTILLALLLLTSMAAPLAISLPAASAATEASNRSFLYVGVSPHTIGLGQETLIVAWTADMPTDVGETAGTVSAPNGRAAWNNLMTVNIVKPDGTNETKTLPRTDPVGATYIGYTPDAVGEYMIQVYFPGEWKNTTAAHTYWQPAWSQPVNLTVQQEATPNWIETPLTTDWWTRPLNSANREWFVLAGSWLGSAANYYPVGTGCGAAAMFGPGSASVTTNYAWGQTTDTAHILWTNQYYAGGLMDERDGGTGFQTAHYQGLSFSGVVLNGQLHFSPRITAHGTQGWETLDLYTGEILRLDYNQTAPSQGQIYNYESPNQHGGFSYLWRTSGVQLPSQVKIAHAKLMPDGAVIRTAGPETVSSSSIKTGTLWEMLDGYTGKTVCYIANVSSGGIPVYGLDGSILRYNIASVNGAPYLQIWNSSAGTMVACQNGTGYWQWRPAGGDFGASDPYFGTGMFTLSAAMDYNNVHDGSLFFSANVSLPSNVLQGPRNSISNQTGSIVAVRQDDYLLVEANGINNEAGIVPGYIEKISLKPGEIGQVIYRKEFTPPSSAGRETVALSGIYPEDNIVIFAKATTLQWIAYNLDTMTQAWISEPEVQFQYYGTGIQVYNSTMYTSGYGGQITAYNIKTGAVLWKYDATSIGTESAYGGNYPCGIVMVGNNRLYTVTGEHSPTQPLMRGPNLRCIDATTGEEVWKILGFFGGMSPTTSNILMADGILVGLNLFDNQLYAFGRGPSATTVTCSDDVSTLGNTIMLKGTVTDQTATGRRDTNNVLVEPLKGTPAISDESMQAWMEYKFMQQAYPADATGVPVSLDTVDPNGNYVHIGDTTSDATGNYAFAYTPEVPGTYQIIATFGGSNAYGSSYGTTYINVGDAPAATAAPTPAPASMVEQYFVPAVIGIIVAMALIGLVIILVLRKRP
ncbi:MAG: PQQ-like beta-propeller repeat protein [Candidatus Bathyarchaeota archaeon]|nr:PQQ-like beta-propeller repeat protein [Candidatus Bathyarchaeota archaeon]